VLSTSIGASQRAGTILAMTFRDGTWRRARLRSASLYLCVDRRARQGDLATLLDAVLAAGVDIIQLRDKTGTEDELGGAAAAFRAAALRHDALFVLNDNPRLAAEVDADGVHVGQDDADPSAARAVVGEERLVGRSTHAVDEIDRAVGEDCDYFAVGPVHATPTKLGRPAIGLDPLRHATTVAGERPWFVTGGMAVSTAPEVLGTGARRLVVVRALTEAADPAAATRALCQVLGRDPG
jgi:thiamine-phosphate pyrophosphorylase